MTCSDGRASRSGVLGLEIGFTKTDRSEQGHWTAKSQALEFISQIVKDDGRGWSWEWLGVLHRS